MSDTFRPRSTKRGMSCSISVVLPLPDHPANPNIFISEPGRRTVPAKRRHCIRASFPCGYSGWDCLLRVREEQLLTADLVVSDDLLVFWGDHLVDER